MKRREEQIKLGATALANIGTASFVGGLVSPVFTNQLQPGVLLFALVYGVGFHLAGQVVLWFLPDSYELTS